MELSKISLTFCLIGIALFPHMCAQDSPAFVATAHSSATVVVHEPGAVAPSPSFVAESPTRSQDSRQDFLNVHNAARAAVGVRPMTWDNAVASYAKNYANQRISDCNLVPSRGPYGENLANNSGNLSGAGADAVRTWINEKTNYDMKSNICASGHACSNYTQVIWANSTRLGCAKVGCDNGGTFVVCNYDPPGNSIGKHPTDGNQSIFGAIAPSPDSTPYFFHLKGRKDMKGLVVGLIVGAAVLISGLCFIWFISKITTIFE